MSDTTTNTNPPRTVAELEREAHAARQLAEQAAARVHEAQHQRRRELDEQAKREDEARERAKREHTASLRQALPPEIAATRNGLVALRDWLQASPWPPGHNGPAFRALDVLGAMLGAIDEAQNVRHADAVRRAEVEANPAPAPLFLSPTWSTRDAVLVVSGAALSRGGIEWTDEHGKRWTLRPAGLVSFASPEQAEAIDAARAARVDYLRRTTTGATAGDAAAWERDADELVGFVLRGDQAADLVGLALRWSGHGYVTDPTPLVADVLRACECPRARVRWATFAERRGRPLSALVDWMRANPSDADEALRFWSADLEPGKA